MGIPSYFNYIIKNYNTIFKYSNDFKEIQNLFLDSNSIIYDCVRKMDYNPERKQDFEEDLIKNICIQIDEYVNKMNVSGLVFIAFDGVAPVAKMKQQQTRRYKSGIINKLENKIKGIQCKEDGKNTKKNISWDQTAITPGTDFMNTLTENITNYYKAKNIENEDLVGNKNNNKNYYIVSGTDKYGEGEHKIFEYIRKNESKLRHKTNFIYGLDADLIMLSLTHLTSTNNLFLCRELPDFKSPLHDLYEKDEYCIMDISEFSNLIYNVMTDYGDKKKNTDINKIDKQHKKRKINDYIFISFLLGNDFLPHFPALNIRTNGIQYLLDTYKKVLRINEYICDEKGIIWNKLRSFISEIANLEHTYLINEYKIMSFISKKNIKKQTEKDKLYALQLLPCYNRKIENDINPYQPYWQNRYYTELFNIDIQSKATGKAYKKFICNNYLQGLEWTYLYYTNGCVNYQWYYKYNYPPLLQDLVNYIPVFDCRMVEYNNYVVHPYTQLSYVLPTTSLQLLPESIQIYLLEKYDNIYSKHHKLEWAFCKYLWEAHIDIPYIDILQLECDILDIIRLKTV